VNRESGHLRAGSRRRVGADTPRRSRRRRLLIALGATALASVLTPHAQSQARVWRIGFLEPAPASGSGARWVEALRAGLRDLGYVEGRNLVIEFRRAEGKYERLPGLAAELVRLEVDVIVTHTTAASRAAKDATTTIPIVMAIVGDPVASGIVASLARPGGNVTGLTALLRETAVKRLELLKEAFPRIRRVAVLGRSINAPAIASLDVAAASLKLELQRLGALGPDEINSAFAAMVKGRVDAVLVGDDVTLLAYFGAIAKLAGKLRLPSIGPYDFAEDGGLMAYSTNVSDFFYRAATLVDRILKGTKPSDLPIEQAMRIATLLNLKTAKALGIQFPQSVLLRADRVIE